MRGIYQFCEQSAEHQRHDFAQGKKFNHLRFCVDSQSRSGLHFEHWRGHLHDKFRKEAIKIDQIHEFIDQLVFLVSIWQFSSISIEQWYATDTSAHQTGHHHAFAEIGM